MLLSFSTRNPVLEAFQQRNIALDTVFYDVERIDASEMEDLSFWQAPEGSLLSVPPTGKGKVQVHRDKASFLKKGGGQVQALVVAGVGSSALGSAAFARNVADALEAPVVAVVSGYGLSDVLTEALGGFLWFGALNSLRHNLEGVDRFSRLAANGSSNFPKAVEEKWARLSKDTATVIDLLSDQEFKIPLLVGHSKGNLVISEALYALEAENGLKSVAKGTRIVTISAKIGMPMSFKGRVLDIMGQWDGFGALNSRPDIPADVVVPRAWHSTNPHFPYGMGIRVTEVLKQSLPLFENPPMPRRKPVLSAFYDLPQKSVGRRSGAC